MRVAYICADPGVPVFGCKGASIHVQEVLSALIRLGASVKLFASMISGERPPALESIEVHELPKFPMQSTHGRLSLDSANEMIRVALERGGPFDLVYERYSLWSFAGMEYASSIGVPGLLEVNAPLIEECIRYRGLTDRASAERAAERVFRAARILIAVSDEIAAHLTSYHGVAEKVHVVPNAVNPDRFPANLKPSRPAALGTFTVGFVGTLKPWHGLALLVEAFEHLHSQTPNTRLLIVGDGPEREELVKDLERRNLLESTELTGAVMPSEVPSLLASMDVGVAPYPHLDHFYFSPLKVYEYMAAGLPVVVSRLGQLAELIQDGVNGLLVPPGDQVALTAALDRLRRDLDLRVRLGNAARTSVLRQHTWDMVVNHILDLSGIRTTAASLHRGDVRI